jgi:hypothetical protein
MIKKLITRIDLGPLDGLMLVAGLLGGFGGAFLAVRASEHRNHSTDLGVAAEPHEARAEGAADAGAAPANEQAKHESAEAEK